MRRRKITIDAENEEDFIREYNRRKNEPNKPKLDEEYFNFNSIKESNDNGEDDDEDDGLSGLKNKNTIIKDEENFDFWNTNEEDENKLSDNERNELNEEKNTSDINEKNNEDLEMLCLYLKKNILNSNNKEKNCNERIFYGNDSKKFFSLSGNAIYDVDFIELANSIINNENYYENNVSLKDNSDNRLYYYILQNIEAEQKLKIMFISNNTNNNDNIKNTFLKNFLHNNGDYNINENIKNYNSDFNFEIKKKILRLFNKNIEFQIYDTSLKFHKNKISSVYYNEMNAFFIILESNNYNIEEFLNLIKNIKENFIKNMNITFVIFHVKNNINSANNNKIEKFCEENKMLLLNIKEENFDINNQKILNLLNLILIKNFDNKKIKKGMDKAKVKENQNEVIFKNLNSVGYKDSYRVGVFNAFDMDEKVNKRKLSSEI